MNSRRHFKQTLVGAAIALALGASSAPQMVCAGSIEANWNGYFRMLTPQGEALGNTSITAKGANIYETPLSGTLYLDLATGVGTATMNSFLFFNNPIPSEATGITLQAIGDGQGGPGALLLVNMLFNWGSTGIPMSLVWDAAGFLNATPGSGVGTVIDQGAPGSVRGAADGTYVGGSGTHITSGYLDLGVVPIATNKWNTTPTCTPWGGNSGACMGRNPSAALPLVADTALNGADYNAFFMGGDGAFDNGIGGSPFVAGPFEGYSPNIDITTLTVTAVVVPVPVPVPAAAWLFGSGLLGLVGMARRRWAGSVQIRSSRKRPAWRYSSCIFASNATAASRTPCPSPARPIPCAGRIRGG